MNSKIKLLVKKVSKFTNLTKSETAQFLLNTFSKCALFELPNKKQKIVIENLLLFFDKLVCGIDTYKIKNKHITENDILNHIESKTFDIVAIINKTKF